MAALLEYAAKDVMDKFVRENSQYTYTKTTANQGMKVSVFVKRGGATCGQFSLESFPGHSNAIISTGSYIEPAFRGLGIGQIFHQLRLDMAKWCGVATVFCTVNKRNDTQLHILPKHGWRKVGDMDNASELWAKRLTESPAQSQEV